MKRKLWIMLALAALMALLWCGSAGADSPNYVFNQQPFGRTLAPGGSYTCFWETNFKPIKVDVCFGTSLSPFVVKTYGELVCEKSMNHVFNYDDGGGIYYIRAYYSGIGSPYVDSTLFVVETIPRGFEISPTGGNVSPSNALTLSWKTNFNPYKFELGHRPSGGNSFTSDVEITTGLSREMSYTLNYDDAYESNDCVLRAYYWNENQIEYVDSDNFAIQRVNEYSCGNNLTAILQNGVLTISGTGDMTDYSSSTNAPWYNQRTMITSVTIGSGVTSIGSYAFLSCSNMTSVTIPDSVTKIGTCAFQGCSSLTTVTIPYSVRSIGYWGFHNCNSLTIRGWNPSAAKTYATNNNIPFESLGDLSGSCGANVTYSFDPAAGVLTISGTGAMTDYRSDTIVPWYRYRDSIKSITIESHVASIGDRAFVYSAGLTNISIPDSVTSIGYWVFFGCHSLTNVTIPNSVISIGEYAFRNSGLISVTLPSNMTFIAPYVFSGCKSLANVTIPDSVTGIGIEAFDNCTSLTSVTILNPDCVIGSNYDVFKRCDPALTLHGYAGSTAEAYAANTVNPCGFELLAPAPGFFLPAALTDIESEAFSGIAAQAVVIPEDIQSISGDPFEGSAVRYIYGFPGTAAETLARNYPARFTFIPLTDAWYARLTE